MPWCAQASNSPDASGKNGKCLDGTVGLAEYMRLINEPRQAWSDARAAKARGEQLGASVTTLTKLPEQFLQRQYQRYSMVLKGQPPRGGARARGSPAVRAVRLP
jgi:hypothetical protein